MAEIEELASTPLGQRSRGLKRGKGVCEAESEASSHDPDVDRIEDDESEIIDVEGSEGDTSDDGKDTKKPRLDVSKESDEYEDSLSQCKGVTDNLSVAEAETEVTRKEDMVSSGDSDIFPPEKSSGEEDMA